MTTVEKGTECFIADTAQVGVGGDETKTVFGDGATVRAGSVIYGDVETGDDFATGHHAVVREASYLGDDVLVGTHAVVDGEVEVGSHVSLQTGAYVPQETILGDEVFLGPHAVITNDAYPIRATSALQATVVEDHVSVGANATILPGVAVGQGSFVAAGAVVTDDVPPETLAVGAPARHRPLPDELSGGNLIA
ncbi:acyltransferase [Halobacteriales archaeon Cl-PHB]